ncbi:hypothetical protein HPB50_022476 [Hyalomma asiaticum]|uniref:Uncharacterized protein n=1 Tax=Hyalomma asiaticum TaxID=266040 RepID=A0ACB7RWQ8_HYAAI|nr:hypothetical protein HPB50_022476 [Hyalomma asiaticum]
MDGLREATGAPLTQSAPTTRSRALRLRTRMVDDHSGNPTHDAEAGPSRAPSPQQPASTRVAQKGAATTGGTSPNPGAHTEESNSSTDTAAPSNLDPTEWPTLPQAGPPPDTSPSRTTPREPVVSSGSPSSTGSSDSSSEESFFSDSSSERSDPESEAPAAPPAVTTATQTSPARVRASSAPPTNRCPFSWETSFAFPTRASRPADATFLSQPGPPANAAPNCLPASLSQPQTTASASTPAVATTSTEDTAPFPKKQPASLQLPSASTERSTSQMHDAPSLVDAPANGNVSPSALKSLIHGSRNDQRELQMKLDELMDIWCLNEVHEIL